MVEPAISHRPEEELQARLETARIIMSEARNPPIDPANTWHTHLLFRLFREADLAAAELFASYKEKNLSRSAWAARNLLELSMWAAYVSASDQNAKRLDDDILLDADELYSRAEGLCRKLPNLMQNADQISAGRNALSGLRTATTLMDTDRRLDVAKVVKSIGHEGSYYVVNALYSKLLHPTPFLMFTRLTDCDPLIEAIYQSGKISLKMILDMLATQFQRFAMPGF
jgi:hypothetical protein